MSESPNWSNPLRDSRDLRLPRIAGPCSLVIFGVTGDLAQKKLLPAVYDLANRGLLPPSFGLTGFARRDWTQERFIEFVKAAVQAHCRTPFKESTWRNLAAGIRFVQGTFDDPEAFERLSATVQELDRDRGTQGNHAFYMSVPPRAFPQVAKQLAASGLSNNPARNASLPKSCPAVSAWRSTPRSRSCSRFESLRPSGAQSSGTW